MGWWIVLSVLLGLFLDFGRWIGFEFPWSDLLHVNRDLTCHVNVEFSVAAWIWFWIDLMDLGKSVCRVVFLLSAERSCCRSVS
jgi:hypothetical protein